MCVWGCVCAWNGVSICSACVRAYLQGTCTTSSELQGACSASARVVWDAAVAADPALSGPSLEVRRVDWWSWWPGGAVCVRVCMCV